MNKPNIDANIIGIFSFRNWLNHPFQDFLNGVNWWGRQCRENGKKLHENDKISIFGSKQWGGGGHGEDKLIFWVVGGGGSPPTRGNPVFSWAGSYFNSKIVKGSHKVERYTFLNFRALFWALNFWGCGIFFWPGAYPVVRKTNSFIAIMMLINANYLQYKNCSKQLPQRRVFDPIVKDADPNTSKNFFLDFYRHLSYKWIDLICLICLIFLESP